MAYEKAFEKPYPNGWEDRPSRKTPITGAIMDAYDKTLEIHDTRIISLSAAQEELSTQVSDADKHVELLFEDNAAIREEISSSAEAALTEAKKDAANNYLPQNGGNMGEDAEVVFEKNWTDTDSDGNVIEYRQKTVISKDGITNYYWNSDEDWEYEVYCRHGDFRIMADGWHAYMSPESLQFPQTSWVFLDTKNGRYNFEDTEFYADGSGKVDLGANGAKWKNIYATNGTIQTSDRNEKNTIADMTTEQAAALIYGLKPSTYKMNAGTSGRTHWGMISQDIEELLKSLGWSSTAFAGFIKSPKVEIEIAKDENGHAKKTEKVVEGEYTYSLRYDEFVAPLIKVAQEQKSEIDSLKEQLATINERFAKLEEKLNQ